MNKHGTAQVANEKCNYYLVSTVHPVDTKHLYNIYTMLDQRRRRWVDVV